MKREAYGDDVEITIAFKRMKIAPDQEESVQSHCRRCEWPLHRTDGYCQQCRDHPLCYGYYPGADWRWCRTADLWDARHNWAAGVIYIKVLKVE